MQDVPEKSVSPMAKAPAVDDSKRSQTAQANVVPTAALRSGAERQSQFPCLRTWVRQANDVAGIAVLDLSEQSGGRMKRPAQSASVVARKSRCPKQEGKGRCSGLSALLFRVGNELDHGQKQQLTIWRSSPNIFCGRLAVTTLPVLAT